MRADTFQLKVEDTKEIFVYRFQPDEGQGQKPKAIVHVAHGMAEHGARYARFAEALTGPPATSSTPTITAATARRRTAPASWASSSAPGGLLARRAGSAAARASTRGAQHLGLPLFLFGHSMGSFLAQWLPHRVRPQAARAPSSPTPTASPTRWPQAGRVVARLERARLGAQGARARSSPRLSFDDFNKAFKPNRRASTGSPVTRPRSTSTSPTRSAASW